jgi:lipid-binding SYLF domain-containing protein
VFIPGLFNVFSSSYYIASTDSMNDELEKMGMLTGNQNLGYYPGICLEGASITTKKNNTRAFQPRFKQRTP